jgi:hypothetical protein
MLKKLSGYLGTYTLVSALALLIPLIITPHMQLHERGDEYSISQILIIASFLSIIASFSLMNMLPIVRVKKNKNYLRRIITKLIFFYIASSVSFCLMMLLYFPMMVSLKASLYALMTMIYSTIIIYHQSIENNGAIVKNALSYYSLNIGLYFVFFGQLGIEVDNSRIFAQFSSVLILGISQIKIFNFDSIFSRDEWEDIFKYVTSIALHVLFGLTLTFLDKVAIFWIFDSATQVKYSFLVLYFMPFAAFYNQLFNAVKPEIYRKVKSHVSVSKYYLYNMVISVMLLTVYSVILYNYLDLMSISFTLNSYVLVALVTLLWTHYLLPASVMIYYGRNVMLSKVSFIFTLIGGLAILIFRDVQCSVGMILGGYLLVILGYNVTLLKLSNDI